MKIISTADIHANKNRKDDVVKLLNIIKEKAIENDVDAVTISGDFWDSAITNTQPFAEIIKAFKVLVDTTTVIMIMGTPSHDVSNSYTIFESLGAVTYEKAGLYEFLDGIKIYCLPEPRRTDFIRQSSKETSKAINDYLWKCCENAKKDNADIMLFHGEIAGAAMDNGVIVNTDTMLTKEMIELSGVKYVLAGHIHSPQTIRKNSVYLGSPIPVTFGETHSPKLTLVNITDKITLSDITLPFAKNKTIDCDSILFSKLFKMNYSDTNVKIRLSLTAEERKLFHPLIEAKKLKEETGANDVKITVLTKKETTIRAKEIVQKTSMLEKLKVYGKVNNIDISTSIIDKAKETEDNLLIKYSFPTHSFELLSLSLRGAIGVKDNEQIDIDFSKYENGIIGLCGENGKGKSTIIENCHPFPRLLTRSGSLKNHFYLKDSHRIVTYSDENGKLYCFIIQISAHVKTGLAKYFVEISDDNGTTWTPVKECDGNLDSYTKYVEDNFGSVDIYLRTAFFAKEQVKGVPDIASATKSERVRLFSNLIGTDNLSAMHDIVKDKMKEIDTEMKLYNNIEDKLEEIDKTLNEKKNSLNFISQVLLENSNSISNKENELKLLKQKQQDYVNNFGSYESALELKNRLLENQENCKKEISELNQLKRRNDNFLYHKKQIEEYKEIKARFPGIEKELRLIQPKYFKINEEVSELKSSYSDLVAKYNNENSKLESVDNRIERAKQQTLEIKDTCPTCGMKLSQKKKEELFELQNHFKADIDNLIEYKKSQKTIVSNAKKERDQAKIDLDKKIEKQTEIKKQFDELNDKFNSVQSYLELNKEFDGFDDYNEIPSEKINSELEKFNSLYEKYKVMLLDLSEADEIDFNKEIEAIEIKLKDLNEEKLNLSVKQGTLEAEINQIAEMRIKIATDTDKMKMLAKDYAEYSVLEQAYSNGGIMALELEAAAPDIASLANTILSESYGDEFYISFTTLHQGRNKLVDDFSIDVTNTETGRTAPIEYLSSGEKVWIIQSLYYAFSIIRMEKTGFSFNVRFVDESDGALDSEARIKYFNMINSAHKAGNARLTVMITHSQELKDILSQSIQL